MTHQLLHAIGGGRMGLAMLLGARDMLRDFAVTVHDPAPGPELRGAAAEHGWALDPSAPGSAAHILLLAIKPQDFSRAVPTLIPAIGPETLVISVMAGLAAKLISEKLGTRRVLRAMPNIPALIGAGVSGLWGTDALTDSDHAFARQFFQGLGMIVELPDEPSLEALTAISGCGPAYVFLLAEALTAAGIGEGLSPEIAASIARQTIIGAGALLAARPHSPEHLRREVTSPNGVTAAAIARLQDAPGLAGLMTEAVRAARRRAAELGES